MGTPARPPVRDLTDVQTALRAARLIRNYTLREVADATGVHTSRLSAFERGIAPPTPAEFGCIWRFLAGR